MAGVADGLESFADDFSHYIDTVDVTRALVQGMLVSMRDTTFSGELAARFEELVHADIQQRLVPLHEAFSGDLTQLRADIEYVRALESRDVNT